MNKNKLGIIPGIVRDHEQELLSDWIKEQLAALTIRPDLIDEAELRKQSAEALRVFNDALQSGNFTDITTEEWDKMRETLDRISFSRAEQGFSPAETSTFIFSLKQPLFTLLRTEISREPEVLANEIWAATALIDRLGIYTFEQFQKSREDLIKRQQEELLELSTPVIKLWEGVLALPLIGTLDSTRTQMVMENLLNKIAETGSGVVILDITGVPVVDTMVAQHLVKAVSAARLMGTECIISGIRPQIAQTMVALGVSFDVPTKSSLAEALAVAFDRAGLKVCRS